MNTTKLSIALTSELKRKVRVTDLYEIAEKLSVPKVTCRQGGNRSYNWNEKHIAKAKELI
jgi:hypothetical protein